MKSNSLLLALLISIGGISPAISKELVFTDIATLREWADEGDKGKSSLDVVRSQKNDAIIVRSSHGSGVPKCELWVFIKSKETWRVALHLFQQNDWCEFIQKGDEIIITLWESKKELTRFSIDALVPISIQ